MTTPLKIAAWPDAERVVMGILDRIGSIPVFGTTETGTHLVPDWDPPFWQVRRVGGGPEDGITDIALVQIHSYGATRDAAWDLAAVAEHYMLEAGGRNVYDLPRFGTVLVDWTDLAVGGSEVPELDPDDRRVTKDYAIACRKHILTLGE